MVVQPSCVELRTCIPDLSNPLQWLDFYGRSLGLPIEFGMFFLLFAIVGAVYIRTHNLVLTSIASLVALSYISTSGFTQFTQTTAVVLTIAISAVLVMLFYKLKGEILQ
ncbi:MAG: hypothetical protein QXQ68_07440 [Candidatus Nitrosocaldaceae archaeon]